MMAKTVTVELDKPRNLCMNLYAQMQFEKATGRSVAEMNNSATDMATLVWACLIQDDESLTVDDVAKMVDIDDMERMSVAIGELTGETVDPLALVGDDSGPSGDTTSA
jgi:hypothetical protein